MAARRALSGIAIAAIIIWRTGSSLDPGTTTPPPVPSYRILCRWSLLKFLELTTSSHDDFGRANTVAFVKYQREFRIVAHGVREPSGLRPGRRGRPRRPA
jgi:hypothetical protein